MYIFADLNDSFTIFRIIAANGGSVYFGVSPKYTEHEGGRPYSI